MTATFQTSSAGLIIRQKEPANLETPLDQVDSYLTPTELFYIRSHFPAPRPFPSRTRSILCRSTSSTRSQRYDDSGFQYQYDNLATLAGHSDRFVAAVLQRSAPRRDCAPLRAPFPTDWELALQRPLQGTAVFLRRTNEQGEAELLGRRYLVDSLWCHRLIRAEVDLSAGQMRFYRLRRREPKQQPFPFHSVSLPPSSALLFGRDRMRSDREVADRRSTSTRATVS